MTATVRGPHWLAFAALAGGIVAADQVTKAWVASALAPQQSTALIDDVLRIVNSQNSGGVFGLLRGQAPVFALLSIGVIALIVGYHARSGRNAYLTLTLGLLLGGAIGNLIDRLRVGYVLDFVDAGVGGVRWYTFNVADAAVSLAIVLLILGSVWPSLGRAKTGGSGRSAATTPVIPGEDA